MKTLLLLGIAAYLLSGCYVPVSGSSYNGRGDRSGMYWKGKHHNGSWGQHNGGTVQIGSNHSGDNRGR